MFTQHGEIPAQSHNAANHYFYSRNIAAHETQGCKRSVYEKYPTRIAAQKAFADAMAAGMVSSISV